MRSVDCGLIPEVYRQFSQNETLEMFRRMCQIRYFELNVQRVYHHEHGLRKPRFPFYLGIGQEAVAAALSMEFTNPAIFGQHRGHDLYIAYGGDLEALVDELLNRSTGCARGMGGSASIHSPAIKMFGHDGFMGTQAPIAVGYTNRTQERTLAVTGDASAEEGYVLGAIGFAATRKTQTLFVCIDNGLSILTKVGVRRSWTMHRHANFGMPGVELADDPWTIMLNLRSLRYHLPALMNIHTCRTLWHAGTGQDGPPEWDRFAIVKTTLEHLSLSKEAETVESACREEMDTLWNRKLEESEPAVSLVRSKVFVASSSEPDYKKIDLEELGKKPTTADVIRGLTRNHILNNNGTAMGQCLTAVGWVGGTVPEMSQGIVELSMDDTSNTGIAVGYALAHNRYPKKYGRPIQIVRYQGFEWFLSAFLNYASKSKDMWNIACPIFHRAVAMEGGMGPVASSSHHGMVMRMPGIRIAAPMTPGEYLEVWDDFLRHDDPYYVSEHRRSFPINYEMQHIVHDKADITLIAISATRLNAVDAIKDLEKDGIVCNLVHQVRLKPFFTNVNIYQALTSSAYGGIVLDTDFENGAGKCIAHDLMLATGVPVHIMGLEERTAGFAPNLDNLPATPEKIVKLVKRIVKK